MAKIECPVMDGVMKEIVFNWMEDNGVTKITATFNGDGDSGSFDGSVSLEMERDLDASGSPVYGPEYRAKLEAIHDKIRDDTVNPPPPGVNGRINMEDYIVHLSKEIENQTSHGVDWWNDEGGDGMVEWILDGEGQDGDPYKRGICLTVRARVIEYETSHFAIRGLVEENQEVQS